MQSIKGIETKIRKTQESLKSLKRRYEQKSQELIKLQNDLWEAQAKSMFTALKKSGKSYEEVMTFLSR